MNGKKGKRFVLWHESGFQCLSFFHKARPQFNLIIQDENPYSAVIAPSENTINRSAKIIVDEKEIEVTPDNITTIKGLGNGAFGVVELVKHEPTGITLAVKVLNFGVKYL